MAKREKHIMYAVHPGNVSSRNDGDRHYIGFDELIRLYGVSYKDCVLWDIGRPETFFQRRWEDYVHLFPREDGNYQT